jgi:osmotically-inducible protein OsmY
MANRYGYEEEPGRWQQGRSGARWGRQDRDAGVEPESGLRRGGRYGIGGSERGYNMGGYGGMSSYEQGYTPRSYDRLLDMSERREDSREEDFGRDRSEDERSWHERNWRGIQGGSMEWRARAPVQSKGKAPKGYTRSDARIREDVCERLMYSPYDASDVEVNVTDGEVTLTGHVRTRVDKWGIEDVAEGVLGVHDVHNQIRIMRSDAQTSAPSTDDTGPMHS